ncbi:MAG: glycosyl transferase, partial [Terracidiphilus sp.]
MTVFAFLLLAIALMGTLSSTVFLILSLAGVRKFQVGSWHQKRQADALADSALPPVSILKPLHGMEPQLERNLESFFQQDYPSFEILFALDTAGDTALPVVRALCEKYPQIPSRIMITGEPPWPNPPAYAFSRMAAEAHYDLLITSDS